MFYDSLNECLIIPGLYFFKWEILISGIDDGLRFELLQFIQILIDFNSLIFGHKYSKLFLIIVIATDKFTVNLL